MFTSLLFIFSVGAIAGFIAGLFGIGGGVVIVPALIVALNHQGVDPEVVIHLAIGTSLATIAVTGASSAYGHWRQGAVARILLLRMLPGLVLGSVAGGVIASLIRADLLERVFGVFLILLALRLIFTRMPRPREEGAGRSAMAAMGGLVGSVSALFGIGGGILSVPWLVRCGATQQRAIGTSAAVGLPIAVVGALTFMITGLNDARLPAGSTGYLYWPAFLGMIVCSVPLARLGVLLAHRLPAALLRRLFALMILGIGIRLLL